MTLQQLRYLVAVAEHQHFGRAADACNVTQPTLSAAIRSLEDELGNQIIDRGRRGVTLTTHARELVDQAREVLKAAGKFERMVRQSAGDFTGRLHLGAIPTIGPYLLPTVLRRLKTLAPDLEIYLHEARTDDLIKLLREGSIDAALLSDDTFAPILAETPLYREQFYLAVPEGHRLSHRKRVRKSDMEGETLLLLDEGHCLRDQALEFCGEQSVESPAGYRATSLETLRAMVEAGLGCTLIPELATRSSQHPRIRYIPFSQPAPERTVVLASGTQGDVRIGKLAQLIASALPDKTVKVAHS